jgi:hypothetical protein
LTEKTPEVQQKTEEKPKAYVLTTDQLRAIRELFRHFGEGLRALKRGMQGLPIDEDAFNGMIDIHRTEERTRVTVEEQYWRTWIRGIGEITKVQFPSWIVEELDRYGIALEGKQWDAVISMKQATQQINVAPVAIPQARAKGEQESGKKGEAKE